MDTGKGKAPLSSEAEQSFSTNKAKTTETFWTKCYGCRMRYEYPKIFLKEKLICIKCEVPFEALETPPPNKNMPSSKPRLRQNKKKQPERKGRRNEKEEWRQMLMMKGKKETTSLINRLKAL